MNRVFQIWLLVAALLLCNGCATRKAQTTEPNTPEAAAATNPSSPTKKKWFRPSLYLAQLLSLPSKLFPKKPAPPQAQPALQIAEVRQVNAENHFVLLDLTTGRALEPGTPLICLADKKQTAELRLTPMRASSFVIADIVSGKPGVKDGVYVK